MVDEEKLEPVKDDSGVPQGTVLGPLIFLLNMNDLPVIVISVIHLFADDYKVIRTKENQIVLQKNLDALMEWTKK